MNNDETVIYISESDVPFFLSQGTAFCTGRGELVHSLPSQDSRPVLIVKPEGGLSTPAVYRTLNIKQSPSEKNIQHDIIVLNCPKIHEKFTS